MSTVATKPGGTADGGTSPSPSPLDDEALAAVAGGARIAILPRIPSESEIAASQAASGDTAPAGGKGAHLRPGKDF